jgi:hypothetical protein
MLLWIMALASLIVHKQNFIHSPSHEIILMYNYVSESRDTIRSLRERGVRKGEPGTWLIIQYFAPHYARQQVQAGIIFM